MSQATPETTEISAAIMVVGDEILSGRTEDKNITFLARLLEKLGITLKHVRIIGDDENEIINHLQALMPHYTYIFTTGGIGPTHDDITAECVAKALNVPLELNEAARAMMLERYTLEDLNEARLRMTRIPHGAKLIPNPISKAPGFWIENVIVMAGVPSIMQAMMEYVAPQLKTGSKVESVTLDCRDLTEGLYASALANIAASHSEVVIGSYSSYREGRFYNQIVLRGRDQAALNRAKFEVEAMLVQTKSPPQNTTIF